MEAWNERGEDSMACRASPNYKEHGTASEQENEDSSEQEKEEEQETAST